MWGILIAILFIYSFFNLLITELMTNGTVTDWITIIIAIIVAFIITKLEEN